MKTVPRRLILFACSTVLAVSTATASHAHVPHPEIGGVAESGDGTIEFTIPTEWRCTNEGICVTCWNVSGHAGTVLVTRDSGGHESRQVPAGHALSVCPP
jgi:hypothetical protein